MNKKVALVIALIVGLSTGLLAVTVGDWIMTTTFDAEPVKVITKEVTLSSEGWKQLEEILDAWNQDNWP